MEIRRAAASDIERVRGLLAECRLSSLDVLDPTADYWVIERNDQLVAMCGLEYGTDSALLRSVAVRGAARGAGLGEKIVGHAIDSLRSRRIERLYLFSKDTGAYFKKLGFTEVSVVEAAQSLRVVPQVKRYDATGWYPDEKAFCLNIRWE